MFEWLALFGLAANLAGTVLLAYSFGPAMDGYQTDEKGRTIILAAFRKPSFFRPGIALVAIGFLVQVPAALKAALASFWLLT